MDAGVQIHARVQVLVHARYVAKDKARRGLTPPPRDAVRPGPGELCPTASECVGYS